MITAESLERALGSVAPPDAAALVRTLSETLAAATQNGLGPDELAAKVTSTEPLLRALAGQSAESSGTRVRFGSGDVPETIDLDAPTGESFRVRIQTPSSPVLSLPGTYRDVQIGDVAKNIYKVGITIQRGAPRQPLQAPALPSNAVLRNTVHEAVCAGLLKGGGDTFRTLTIIGMAGTGKSLAAIAAARDPRVLARFPDGVLWTALGQEPRLVELLSGWIQALGDYDFSATAVEPARRHLTTLLQQKSMLLVCDDAWDPSHVQVLLAGGPKCVGLVTTREGVVARDVSADAGDIYELGVMTVDQALAVLAGGEGRNATLTNREDALSVANAVGYLPLALALAAAQAADGISWTELRADLEEEVARLEALDDPAIADLKDPNARKRRSLVGSLLLSLRRLGVPTLHRLAWLGVLPEDASISPRETATLWGTDVRDARETLRLLRSKALLLGGDTSASFRLHDVVHDMAKKLLTRPASGPADDLPTLGIPLADAHRQFLDRYRTQLVNGQWHTVTDDGHILSRLAWHLERAGLADELHDLLAEENEQSRNGWFTVRDQHAQLAGYLSDVRQAWDLAEVPTRESPPDPAAEPNVGIRYGLILGSVAALARNVPPALLDALLRTGKWTPAQALTYARRAPDLAHRTRALASVAAHLPPTEGHAALHEALQVAQLAKRQDELAFSDRGSSELMPWLAGRLAAAGLMEATHALVSASEDWNDHAHILEAILPFAPADARPALLSELSTAAESIGPLFRAGRLESVAKLLPEPLIRSQLAAASRIEFAPFRASVTAQLLAPLASFGHVDEARSIAEALEDTVGRHEALATLLPYVDSASRSTIISRIHAVLSEIDDEAWRASLEPGLAPLGDMSELLIEYVLSDMSWRAAVIETIAPFLDSSEMATFLDAVASFDDVAKSLAVAALASHGPPDVIRELTDRMHAILRSVESTTGRARGAIALAPKLSDDARKALITGIFDAIAGNVSAHERAELLSALAPLLDSEGHQRVLDTVQSWRDDDRYAALEAIAPHLPTALLDEALLVARRVGDDTALLLAAAALASGLDESVQLPLTSWIEAVPSEYVRARAIAAMAPYATPAVFDRLLHMAREIEDPSSALEVAVPALARHSPEPLRLELLTDAIRRVRAMHDGDRAAWIVAANRDLLPDALLADALAIAPDVARNADDELAASALVDITVALLPRLTGEARSRATGEAVSALEAVRKDNFVGSSASALLPFLSGTERERIVQRMRDIADPYERAIAYGFAISALPASVQTELFGETMELVAEIAEHSQADVEERVSGAAARVLAYGSDAERTLDLVGSLTRNWRQAALIEFAPRLPAHLFRRAIDLAETIEDAGDRALALSTLARHAPIEHRQGLIHRALEVALGADSDLLHDRALPDILDALADLPDGELAVQWRAATRAMAERRRADICAKLAYLAPVVRRVGGASLASATVHAIGDVGRWWP